MSSVEHSFDEHNGSINGGPPAVDDSHGPWKHIIGYAISLVLTAVALWMVVSHVALASSLFAIIVILAVLQAFVQLFFFMHINESHAPQWPFHVWMLTLGLLFTITVIVGSIWIMSFGSESY
ncbi:MAG: cytochrome C oxidase subunit IV family protein [Acidibacillus sp.]|uniref:Quinol oxidase subunit 4 n=1 Tax=Sulfoacidibacillus ferrooxidans TaxID=2005001 RepID=A0A9X1V8C2_9BACL|nr:cytochrome C oxidase subunit IV family protein [Sulfoacidibacillus ferrooxidans]MCI0182660.1 hypothetical protein [Sulfoacidibacillus ferrooxidans]MCY0894068.1 cytochrome C oxidase subunit IV family protein [Acidibacillus sp.]